jgi:hypothetical protein
MKVHVFGSPEASCDDTEDDDDEEDRVNANVDSCCVVDAESRERDCVFIVWETEEEDDDDEEDKMLEEGGTEVNELEREEEVEGDNDAFNGGDENKSGEGGSSRGAR